MRKGQVFLTIALLGQMAVASFFGRETLDFDQPHVHIDIAEFAGPVPTTFASVSASGAYVQISRTAQNELL
jgi:hypothetical protein